MSHLSQREFHDESNRLEAQAEQLGRDIIRLTGQYPSIPPDFIADEVLAFTLDKQRFRSLYQDVRSVLNQNGGHLKAATLKVERVSTYLNKLADQLDRLRKRLEEDELQQYNTTVDSEANDLDRFLKAQFPQG